MLRATTGGVTLAVRAQPGAKENSHHRHLWRRRNRPVENRRPGPTHRRPRQRSPQRIPRRKIQPAQVRHHADLGRTLPHQSLPPPRCGSSAGTGSTGNLGKIIVWNYRAQAPNAADSVSSGSGRTRKSACASASTTRPAWLITYVAGTGRRQLFSPFTNGIFTRIDR
jgi:hypothetical protein